MKKSCDCATIDPWAGDCCSHPFQPAFTIDRINGLHVYLGWPQITTTDMNHTGFLDADNNFRFGDVTPGHTILDKIDKAVGINTRKAFVTKAEPEDDGFVTVTGLTRPALLGERLRRLERHIFNNIAPAYFHLGVEAEKLIGAGLARR